MAATARRAGRASAIGVVLLRLRALGRVRWRAWVGVALLAGILGGTAIAGFAAARRTESAYTRFLAATRPFDVFIANGGTTSTNVNEQFSFGDVAHLPQVSEAALVRYYLPTGVAKGRPVGPGDISPFVSDDGTFGTRLNIARPVRGRLPSSPDEIALTIAAGEHLHLDVGDSLQLHLGLAGSSTAAPAPPDEMTAFRVVGVVAMQAGFPPITGGLPPPVLLAPAFGRAHHGSSETFAVRLRRGRADIVAFQAELDRLAHGEQVVTTYESELTPVVQRGAEVDATALRVVAVLVAALALVVVGQALVRQAAVEAEQDQTLRAMGITRMGHAAVGLARSALVAAASAVVALGTAALLSPLAPIGVVRDAEVHPGIDLDRPVLLAGLAALVVLVVAGGTIAAVVSSRAAIAPAWHGAARRRHSRLAAVLAGAGLPPLAVTGVQMAVEPARGRASSPLRATLLGTVMGIAMITAVLTFTSSLGRLLVHPQLYGWNWDAQIGDAFSDDLSGSARHLVDDPRVTAVATGTISRIQLGSLRVDTLAFQSLRGDLQPVVIEGRAPRGPAEVLVGTRTLRDLHANIGDTVQVGLGGEGHETKIVGRGVLTDFAGGARFGEGAAMTLDGMRRLDPVAPQDVVLLRLRRGVALASVLRGDPALASANLYVPNRPSDLANLEHVRGAPSLMAVLLAIVALVTLAHALAASVRQRHRDLAILQALGCVRRQIVGLVAWQATALVSIALAIGLPLGIATGRAYWRVFADHLGARPEVVTPLVGLTLVVPMALVLANTLAAVPAWRAARRRPAPVLRGQ